MESFLQTPRALFVGKLQRDFYITPDDQIYLDVLGGNLIYASAGYKVWEKTPPPGLIARVGEDFPRDWLEECQQRGFDTRGIKILPRVVDLRSFSVYTDKATIIRTNPTSYFSRLGIHIPKALLGYRDNSDNLDSRTQLKDISIRQADIPDEYMDATAAHVCPLDFLTHNLLPAVFRQGGFTTVTLDPSPGYMNPTYFNDVPSIVTGLTAFLPSEDDLRNLFAGRSDDVWEMAEALGAYNCEIIVIKRGAQGQFLYDAESKERWRIPAYPSRLKDPCGVEDGFCGGFLAGFRKTFDPLEAVLYGNIAASIISEGSGVFYALDALPGLAEARLDNLRQTIQRV